MALFNDQSHTAKVVIDSSVGGAAVSAPLWLQWIETYDGAVMFVGGVVLISIRLVIAWRDLQRKSR